MITVKNIIDVIEKAAPKELAEEWDNAGLQVGSENMEVTAVLTALDCDTDTVLEAERLGCNMIVTHHPLIFHPLNFVTDETETGKVVLALAKRGMALYSAHTNLDCAAGGINDYLCEKIGLKNVKIQEDAGGGNLIRIGKITPKKFSDFALEMAGFFGKKCIRCVGDPEKIIETVAVCSGGGGDYISEVADKCDVYMTGDVKYHTARSAAEAGLCLVMPEHYDSEICAEEIFENILKAANVRVYKAENSKNVIYDIFR